MDNTASLLRSLSDLTEERGVAMPDPKVPRFALDATQRLRDICAVELYHRLQARWKRGRGVGAGREDDGAGEGAALAKHPTRRATRSTETQPQIRQRHEDRRGSRTWVEGVALGDALLHLPGGVARGGAPPRGAINREVTGSLSPSGAGIVSRAQRWAIEDGTRWQRNLITSAREHEDAGYDTSTDYITPPNAGALATRGQRMSAPDAAVETAHGAAAAPGGAIHGVRA